MCVVVRGVYDGRLTGTWTSLFRLPEIQEELERGIIATRQALDRLPPPPSMDPVNDIANLLHIFTSELQRHCIQGVPHPDGLLQAMRPAQLKFRKAIRETAPEFVPFEREKAGKKVLLKPRFLDNEEEYGEEGNDGPRARPGKVPRSVYVDEVYERAMQSVFFSPQS